ncbi:HlyIII-domain-containing protein [Rozella allomycis CSF55]|uniref:Hly-III-related domain-containing protein n=1 Tax=Rozella allomycis (strain CSF55) TaxID=988480 RepID=A0A075AS04_ROZAC|nr:Hly-III-related domain-containing protein [Rozella allomycis CSF55]RKP21959.1 HlyIII-domain-containing protein [Rozella allomycis CSF55]|eukprot:EPZ32960.1 Hly-III-related domain-containing protein [Rozella allomycis CSF55]
MLKLALISSIGIFGPIYSKWSTPEFRTLRTIIYISSGAFSAIPVFHAIYANGMPNTPRGFYGWPLTLGTYLCGALIYASRMPERFFPGKFDYVAHSHQFWHLFVVFGVLVQYYNCIELLEWKINNNCV